MSEWMNLELDLIRDRISRSNKLILTSRKKEQWTRSRVLYNRMIVHALNLKYNTRHAHACSVALSRPCDCMWRHLLVLFLFQLLFFLPSSSCLHLFSSQARFSINFTLCFGSRQIDSFILLAIVESCQWVSERAN